MAGRALENNSQHGEWGGTTSPSGRAADVYLPGDEAQKAMCCFVYNNILQEWNNEQRSLFSPLRHQSKWATEETSTAVHPESASPLRILPLSWDSFEEWGLSFLWREERGRGENGHWTKRDWPCLTRARRSRLLRNAGLFEPHKSLRGTSAVLCPPGQFGLVFEAVVTHRD